MESLTCTPQPTLSHELRALINQRNILTAKSKAKVLNELDKQIEENNTKRHMYLRNRVVEEIFTSEISYLHQLEIIMKYFKEPLDSSDLLSPAAKKILFGNVESIYRVNGELVNELKTEGNNIAAAFMHLAPFFKLYSMYIYEYKNILSLLEELSKSNPKLSVWIKNQESRPEVTNSLSALLIVPVQRLPRYRLLLSRLLSLTPASHPHHSTLVEAVKEVEKATAHVDSLVVEQEVQERVLTLQKCLVGSKPSIVAPNKKLLREGVLMTIESHSKSQKAQRNYVILLSDSLLFCKFTSRDRARFRPPIKPGSLRCCCMLSIGKCSVQTVLGQGMFTLSCCNKSFTIYSDVKEEVICWVDDIEGAISQYQDNEKTLRKKRSSSRHSLLLNRKRKCLKENESTNEIPSPAKRIKVCDPDVQESEDKVSEVNEILQEVHLHQREKTHFLRPIKALFQTFGESVRRYLYPGPASS